MTAEMNRRNFLSVGAASAAALATRETLAVDKPEANLVDAHAHVWDKDLEKYPLAKGLTSKDLKPPTFTPNELLKVCRPHGVNRVVLIQHNLYHRFDNSYIVDCIAKHPGVFAGVAVVDHKGKSPATEVVKLKAQGITGFRIVPRDWHGDQRDLAPNIWLASQGMRAVWKAAGENGMAMCPLINPRYLPSVAIACAKFPDTKVVIDHFGRVGVDGTIRDKDLKNLCRVAKFKNAHVKLSAFYALGKKTPPYTDLIPMIKRVIDAFGVERCMWASDCPYQVGGLHTYGPSIDLIKKGIGGLTDTDKSWLLRRTAEKVYFPKS